MLKAILQLPRTVWLLGLVSLFNDSTSELIYPLVPCVARQVIAYAPCAVTVVRPRS